MLTGKPAVPVVRNADPRTLEGAFNAIRERLRLLDAATNTASTEVGVVRNRAASAAQIAVLQAQFDDLQAAIGGEILTQLQSLLNAASGFVVVSGGELLSRTLTAGDNITITNPTGASGNPVISSTASGGGGGASLLGTVDGDYIGDENGNRFLVSRG
jgi:hypothetical protein